MNQKNNLYAVVDIETTGLGAAGNKITEISIFIFDGKKIIDEYTTLVNPESPISYKISGLTGITNDMVRVAPKFYEIAEKVVKMTQGCIFVAHSVNFDYNVIKYELNQLGAEFKRKKLCTVRLSRKLIPGQRSYSLGALCNSLGIDIKNRHRARGDAAATVILFQKLLALDTLGVFEAFLNPRSRQATLPPLLEKEILEKLPNRTGVYYFKDNKGQIIYIGKALDIKQRVLSHIYSKANKELKLCHETADISFTLTGNELTALLLESDEIKKHFPKYNRSQKRNTASYGIGTYTDRQGIIHIIHNRLKLIQQPLLKFYTLSHCRSFLEELCEKYELCPKYCTLQNISGGCFHYQIKMCRGVCRGTETIDKYNIRVKQALELLLNKESYIIKERGRSKQEQTAILIKEGVYYGFGFIPASKKLKTVLEYESYIELKQDNIDIQRIINSYLNNNNSNIIQFNTA